MDTIFNIYSYNRSELVGSYSYQQSLGRSRFS